MAKNNKPKNTDNLVNPKAQAAFENYLTSEYAQMLEPSPFLGAVKKYPAQGLDSGIAIVESIDHAQKSITLNMQKAATPTFQITSPWYLTDSEKSKAGKVYTYKVVPDGPVNVYTGKWSVGPQTIYDSIDWNAGSFFGVDRSTAPTFKPGDIVQNKVPYPDTWTHGEVLELTDYNHAIIAILFPQERQHVTFQVYTSTLTLVPHKKV